MTSHQTRIKKKNNTNDRLIDISKIMQSPVSITSHNNTKEILKGGKKINKDDEEPEDEIEEISENESDEDDNEEVEGDENNENNQDGEEKELEEAEEEVEEEMNESEDSEYSDEDDGNKVKVVKNKTKSKNCYVKNAKTKFQEDYDDEIEDDVVIEKKDRITRPILTHYEYVRLLSVRSEQIARGAKPMVKHNYGTDFRKFATEIAKEEIKHKTIPLIIERPIPNSSSEKWHIREFKEITYI